MEQEGELRLTLQHTLSALMVIITALMHISHYNNELSFMNCPLYILCADTDPDKLAVEIGKKKYSTL